MQNRQGKDENKTEKPKKPRVSRYLFSYHSFFLFHYHRLKKNLVRQQRKKLLKKTQKQQNDLNHPLYVLINR